MGPGLKGPCLHERSRITKRALVFSFGSHPAQSRSNTTNTLIEQDLPGKQNLFARVLVLYVWTRLHKRSYRTNDPQSEMYLFGDSLKPTRAG